MVLDPEKIKKLKRGELIGTVATVFCLAVFLYFVAGFSAAFALKNDVLKVVIASTAGGLCAVGIGVAAFSNFRYGAAMDRLIDEYILSTFVENAEKLHPERASITFSLDLKPDRMEITANNFKPLTLDFSALGKLTPSRRSTIFSSVETRLTVSFIRLWERGGNYQSVSYKIIGGNRRRKGKAVDIIKDGEPEKRALRLYVKNK